MSNEILQLLASFVEMFPDLPCGWHRSDNEVLADALFNGPMSADDMDTGNGPTNKHAGN